MPTIRLEQVTKIYRSRSRRAPTVLDLSLKIEQGEFVFVVGGPGAGKTTLLKLIGGELTPDEGMVLLGEVNLRRMSSMQRARLRREIGVVAQEPRIVKDLTVRENLAPRSLADKVRDFVNNEPLVEKSLALVGLAGYEGRYPMELSASENRRIELARAIMHSPSILLLDALTEGVDEDAGWDMMHLLSELSARGTTVVVATGDGAFVNFMRKRVVTLSEGKLVSDVKKGRV